MRFEKNNILIAMVAIVVILFVIGICFVAGVHSVLIASTQDSLQKISEQGANAVRAVIEGNLDALSALSEQKGLTDENDQTAKMKILQTEAKRKNFMRVAYADKNGLAVTNDGKTVSVSQRAYFQKALAGYSNLSGELTDLINSKNQIVAYAVPVIRAQKIVGVLIATAYDDKEPGILDHITVDSDHSIYVFSRNGSVISNRNGQTPVNDFFQYIGVESKGQEVEKIRADFFHNQCGKGICTINGADELIGYSGIRETDGWMFVVMVSQNKMMAQANQILAMSAVMVGVLIFEFIMAGNYFLKLKKTRYEATVRRKEEIKYFTYTDTLTNLPNRMGIKKDVSGWIKLCRAGSENGGAFFLDVDNFQSVNNTFGNNVGDAFLTAAAARLTAITGEKNLIGRIGGDEFVLFISDMNTAGEVEEFAKQIIQLFKEPFLIHKNVIQLTCSIGAILFHYKEIICENGFDEIINRGEFVMNEAKSKSKGSYALFNDELGVTIDYHHQMQRALKMSIHNRELTCYYQPHYNHQTKAVVGFEALARWNSAKFGMVSPAQFIAMAEDTGFIKELGRFVIDQAFAFAASLKGRSLRVSFNTSPVELLQADFTDYVVERFHYYGLEPKSVAIEVTESCLIESFDEVIKKLQILSECGIYVYLDDFGTGFSSLTYLKKLPIHSVKIDKSFIDEIVTDKVEKEIVDMIVHLAYKLNLEVIAEGVETQEQARYVSECGCNIIQGYFISPPVPMKDTIPLLDVLHK